MTYKKVVMAVIMVVVAIAMFSFNVKTINAMENIELNNGISSYGDNEDFHVAVSQTVAASGGGTYLGISSHQDLYDDRWSNLRSYFQFDLENRENIRSARIWFCVFNVSSPTIAYLSNAYDNVPFTLNGYDNDYCLEYITSFAYDSWELYKWYYVVIPQSFSYLLENAVTFALRGYYDYHDIQPSGKPYESSINFYTNAAIINTGPHLELVYENENVQSWELFMPTLNISENRGPAGAIVTFTGSYYTPDNLVIIVPWSAVGSTYSSKTTYADENGDISVTHVIPNSLVGKVFTYYAIDNYTNMISDNVYYTVTSKLYFSVYPHQGPYGTKIHVTGSGFSPDNIVYVLYSGWLTELQWEIIQSDENGNIDNYLYIPTGLFIGQNNIYAVDNKTLAQSDDVIFTVISPVPTTIPSDEILVNDEIYLVVYSLLVTIPTAGLAVLGFKFGGIKAAFYAALIGILFGVSLGVFTGIFPMWTFALTMLGMVGFFFLIMFRK